MRVLALCIFGMALCLPSEANAQHRGRRGGDRWYGGSRGYYNPYYNGGKRYYPSWSFGFGSYFPGYYSYPQTYYYESVPRTSYYFDNTDTTIQSIPTFARNQARVEVRVMHQNDEVLVQGQLMPGSGMTRYFVSPELSIGREYTYTISVRHLTSTSRLEEDRRTVDVKAGSNVVVDFTQPELNRLPAPGSSAVLPR